MENIFSLCNQLKSVSKIKKQSLLNKPYRLFVDDTELGSYIFRASGDVYISKEGDVSSGFYQFNEQAEKIQIEFQKQIYVYDIVFMNDILLITNSQQGVLSIFTTENSIENLDDYLNGLLSPVNQVIETKGDNAELVSTHLVDNKNSSKNKLLIWILIGLISGALAFYFFQFNKSNSTVAQSDIEYKQTVIKIFDYMNLRKDDSLFNFYADTIDYYGKANTLKSDAVIDYRNLITNTISDFRLMIDTFSIVVTKDLSDSGTIVTGIVIQNSTLVKNQIPYIYRSKFEYRFNKFGKINFINSTIIQKDVDYNAIIGAQESDLYFNNEIEATDFLTRNFGRMFDQNFSQEYRTAISQALLKKVGINKIVVDYNSPSQSYQLGDFIDSLINSKFLLKGINRVMISNGSISEISALFERAESSISEIANTGYYLTNATNENLVYFYASPNEYDKKQSYFNDKEQVYVSAIENGFGYVEFTNSRGQTSKGWLRLQDLIVTSVK